MFRGFLRRDEQQSLLTRIGNIIMHEIPFWEMKLRKLLLETKRHGRWLPQLLSKKSIVILAAMSFEVSLGM